MIDYDVIYTEGKEARTNSHQVIQNSESISRSFINKLRSNKKYNIQEEDIDLLISDLKLHGITYKGHAIIKIKSEKVQGYSEDVFVDLTLDQFSDKNKERLGFSIGKSNFIPDVNIFTNLNTDEVIYTNIRRKIKRGMSIIH